MDWLRRFLFFKNHKLCPEAYVQVPVEHQGVELALETCRLRKADRGQTRAEACLLGSADLCPLVAFSRRSAALPSCVGRGLQCRESRGKAHIFTRHFPCLPCTGVPGESEWGSGPQFWVWSAGITLQPGVAGPAPGPRLPALAAHVLTAPQEPDTRQGCRGDRRCWCQWVLSGSSRLIVPVRSDQGLCLNLLQSGLCSPRPGWDEAEYNNLCDRGQVAFDALDSLSLLGVPRRVLPILAPHFPPLERPAQI